MEATSRLRRRQMSLVGLLTASAAAAACWPWAPLPIELVCLLRVVLRSDTALLMPTTVLPASYPILPSPTAATPKVTPAKFPTNDTANVLPTAITDYSMVFDYCLNCPLPQPETCSLLHAKSSARLALRSTCLPSRPTHRQTCTKLCSCLIPTKFVDPCGQMQMANFVQSSI